MLVSKQHFRIYSIIYDEEDHPDDPPLVYCEDLESSNGTYVNGVLIGISAHRRPGYLLSHGDVIEIRPYWKFRFHQQMLEPNRTRDKIQVKELQVCNIFSSFSL
jgi:pSer/pThr/pTyr-binding forkhead associated (FHA) protein